MSAWEWIIITVAVVANLGASIYYARVAERFRADGRLAFKEAKFANEHINKAMEAFQSGRTAEAFELMDAVRRNNEKVLAEMGIE